MGSRTVDFLNPTLTDHGTDNLVVRELDDIEDDFDLYHDYAYNASSHHLCDSDMATANDSSAQVRSPGIIFVVEAEDVDVGVIEDGESLTNTLAKALADEGFDVVSSEFVINADGKNIASIILKEGYVIARTIVDKKYCGFDIHFWSSLDKHEIAKNALVSAVDAKAPRLTSYR